MSFENDESPYCIDFTKNIGRANKCLDKNSQTIPDLIYLKARIKDRIALAFDAEKVGLTFEKCKTEMETIAAGFLACGLKPGDRILIAGSNYSQVFLCALGASRAGLIFTLANPGFPNSEVFANILNKGAYKAVVCFPVAKLREYLYGLLLELHPGIKVSERGNIQSEALPTLTHIFLAEEDCAHAGCFTLSDVYLKATPEMLKRLPSPNSFDENRVACLQFTQGGSGEPKLVALTHFQLLNGARAVVHAFKVKREHILSCALPLFRIPIFTLCCLAPFLTECRTVFPEPSPLPRNLYQSIQKYQCTTLITNGAALRLLLKVSSASKAKLASIQRLMLIGERVPQELLFTIKKQCVNAQIIAVGYLLTETGSIPIMADEQCDFRKNVGRAIAGYEADLEPIADASLFASGLGELKIRPFQGSTFAGYSPKLAANEEWIYTGDICRRDFQGNFEVVAQKEDLIYDAGNRLVRHWDTEKNLIRSELLKGCQLVSVAPGEPMIAVCVCKNQQSHLHFVRSELLKICNNAKVPIPQLWAFVDDYPRVNCRIQKWKLRQMIRDNLFPVF
ncbi:unnamed protein product, partial [Mesorhabditis spiculigera]